jgi:hypothetical protein
MTSISPDDILNELKMPTCEENNDYKLFADIINDPIDIPKPVSPVSPISIKEFPTFKFPEKPIPENKNTKNTQNKIPENTENKIPENTENKIPENTENKSPLPNVTDVMNTTTFITLNFIQTSLNSKIATCRFIMSQPNINNTTKNVINTYINDMNGYLQMITFTISEYTKERILHNNLLNAVPSVNPNFQFPSIPQNIPEVPSKKRKKK